MTELIKKIRFRKEVFCKCGRGVLVNESDNDAGVKCFRCKLKEVKNLTQLNLFERGDDKLNMQRT